MSSVPKASGVKGLATLQTRGKILKVICELLILAELNHVIEVLYMLDDGVQLQREKTLVISKRTCRKYGVV